MAKDFLKVLLGTIATFLFIEIVVPAGVSLYYGKCSSRPAEQRWLDEAIGHLKALQANSDDPQVVNVLDYTIHRYHRIGAFDVMIFPLLGDTAGVNAPWLPGITLDPEVMYYSTHAGAMVLVHEALHDYWPFFGHGHVTPVMQRIENIPYRANECVKRTCTMTNPNETLLRHGRNLGVQSILTGRQNPVLQQAAEAHAAYQARVQHQGHQNWAQRVNDLRRQMPDCGEFKEVVNESWPGQNLEAAAEEMYRSWRQSTGHWSAVNGRCDFYGYAMVRSANGIWYACGIFALRRKG